MQISEVNITLIKSHTGLIGFASLVIDNDLFVSGIGIHQKLNGTGYRLTYPTRKAGTQTFNIFHPINRTAGKALEDKILEKLSDVMNRLEDNDRYSCPDVA